MPKKTISEYAILALFVLSITALAMWLGVFVSENDVARELIADYGYVGALILGFVGGFNFIAPIPAAAFIPTFAAANANVPIIIAAIILGATLGDIAGYFIGKTGRIIVSQENKEKISYLEKIRRKYYTPPLLFLFIFAAFIPLPNELVVVPLGFWGYTLKQIFPVVLAGNAVFNVLASLAFLGIFGQII